MIAKPWLLTSVAFAAAFSMLVASSPAAKKAKIDKPDLTHEPIPKGASHDWNLGATGARGWMFSDKLATSDARVIASVGSGFDV